MIIKHPWDTAPLQLLWAEAFGDDAGFISAFLSTGFSPDRCRCVEANGAAAALYWFDCLCQGKKLAYLYGIATRKDLRGQGLCKALMEDTHRYLKGQGYAGCVLVPAQESLRQYYRRFGYADFGGIREMTVSATTPVAVRSIDPEEYAALRQGCLPAGGVELGGDMLAFFSKLAKFYAGDGFVFAVSQENGKWILPELLGECPDFGGVAAALGAKELTVRIPGDTPFAMYLPLEAHPTAPTYFGIALD